MLIALRLDLTQNLKYDRLTKKILQRSVKEGDNCIDIGCHKGEILDLFLRFAPRGLHYAFEPIPYLNERLKVRYQDRVKIYSCALSDSNGETSFQLVKNAPAYSGIKKRRYDISDPEIEEIVVEMKTLDEVVGVDEKIHFIKIDVEGGEFGVLKGARRLLEKNKPMLLFECGKGASEYYNTTPSMLFEFITNEVGMSIRTLESFLKDSSPMTDADFQHFFDSGDEYYFVASAD